MAVGSQLQALPLRPGPDGGEPLAESGSPGAGAQAPSAGLKAHQPVEQPSADEMEELREELYGEGGVNPAAAQKGHGVHQSVQQHLCNRSQVRRGGHVNRAHRGEKTGRVSDVTAASWRRATLLRMDHKSRQMNHQLLLQTLQQTATGSQKHVSLQIKAAESCSTEAEGPNQGPTCRRGAPGHSGPADSASSEHSDLCRAGGS